MDDVLAGLVDLIHDSAFDRLSPSAVATVTRHVLDTVGCGAGGFASEPARIARQVTRGWGGDLLASGYGTAEPRSVAAVAFANATANRYLDFNDFGVSGHPSDMIPALLAMAEATGADGSRAVLGVWLAYEVATRLAEAVPSDGGWDQGIYCSLGVAAGQAAILGLDRPRTAHALALAAVPAVPLRATRFGALSHWKASATGHAAMTATFAVQLAAEGMTGPPDPFRGKDGLLERVWPSFELDLHPTASGGPTAIERASLKRHPACYWGQVPVDLALELRARVPIADVERIAVRTCVNAWRSIGGGRGDAAAKWRPPTRETADHSMPFLMAAALLDGGLSDAAFTPERLHDPRVLDLVDRISVDEGAELSARATRDTCPTVVRATLRDGSTHELGAELARGHHAHPLSDGEITAKFAALAGRALDPAAADELLVALRGLPRLPSLAPVGEIFRRFRAV